MRIGKRCYVGNLAWKTSWQDLKDTFRECGSVVYANVMRDDTGRITLAAAISSGETAQADHLPHGISSFRWHLQADRKAGESWSSTLLST